jgi:hypothetical protein
VYELRLVTMYHADHLTARAGLNSLRELPYRVELRKVRNQRQRRFIEEKGVPAAKRVNDGVPILDTGQNITLFDGHLLSGLRLEPYLWAPRIVHIPDEPQPLRKWRAEFRQGWTDSGGQLSWEQEASLRQAIRECNFVVKAVWLNPPSNPPSPSWINLVLYVPHAALLGNQARLDFQFKGYLPFVRW